VATLYGRILGTIASCLLAAINQKLHIKHAHSRLLYTCGYRNSRMLSYLD